MSDDLSACPFCGGTGMNDWLLTKGRVASIAAADPHTENAANCYPSCRISLVSINPVAHGSRYEPGEGMFFVVAKVLWFLLQPSTLMVGAVLAGTALSVTAKWCRLGRGLAWGGGIALVISRLTP